MADQRQQAEEYLKEGVTHIAAAFNLASSREWRQFDHGTRARAEELLRELVCLFHENWPEIPAMIPWGDPRLREVRAQLEQNMRWLTAREDKPFQDMMATFTRPRKDNRR